MSILNERLQKVVLGVAFALTLSSIRAEEAKPILLPPPQASGGKSLMEVLTARRSVRDMKPDKLPPQILSNLLWAGFGINRAAEGRRTAPSAMNSQEIDLYVALPEGLYLYEAPANRLKPVLPADLREKTGQTYSKDASLVLIFVADLPRLAKAKPDMRTFYASFDAGCISQNVYLYCASEGLATVVYDLNRPALSRAMELGPEQYIIMAQAVGYPK
jgi:nitroreductase